jgi:mono/diheme cytochrome c family protein
MKREPATPVPPPWGDQPVSFLRDVQPVFDRHCVRCHSGLKPAGGLDFIGGLITHDSEVAGYGHNRAYETLLARGLVSISAVRAQDASITPPLAYGSLKSPLILALTNRQHRGEVNLPEEDRLRLAIWIDANAPYHDQFVNKRPAEPAYDLAQDKTLADGLAAIHTRRCAGCHKIGDITRLDWIDLRDPDRALFLAAPLAKAAKGRTGCGPAVYQDTRDPDYQAARQLVAEALEKTWRRPRRDLVSLPPPPPPRSRQAFARPHEGRAIATR